MSACAGRGQDRGFAPEAGCTIADILRAGADGLVKEEIATGQARSPGDYQTGCGVKSLIFTSCGLASAVHSYLETALAMRPHIRLQLPHSTNLDSTQATLRQDTRLSIATLRLLWQPSSEMRQLLGSVEFPA